MKGFSRSNLMYMRAFAEAWPDGAIVQPPVGQLPWAHQLVLLTKLKTPEARVAHAEQAVARGWSRNVLVLRPKSCDAFEVRHEARGPCRSNQRVDG
jgi:predicted nuclease of restriction endonuclease-like (RecB) superfamily